jgi:hypothetical protein
MANYYINDDDFNKDCQANDRTQVCRQDINSRRKSHRVDSKRIPRPSEKDERETGTYHNQR